ncbi:MAG: hypothetical protein KGR99_13225 [Betaproteobacteria bacterium]|nr:hypothetical protein [Betaproteobacteria bacterium]MDE2153589.1 hypothetical protein [Betaproteobacteria bacterium]
MTAPSSFPERGRAAPDPGARAWWRVPVVWLLIGLFAAVIAASVATVMIAHRAADDEIEAPARVAPIVPPAASAAQGRRS